MLKPTSVWEIWRGCTWEVATANKGDQNETTSSAFDPAPADGDCGETTWSPAQQGCAVKRCCASHLAHGGFANWLATLPTCEKTMLNCWGRLRTKCWTEN
mmetsp:Transcript_94405/g.177722  ORF Transcript_94405/g.177722 Transcript_94405/m.177722 type:complete len:100 (+) Transcript_94405:417-716(+)